MAARTPSRIRKGQSVDDTVDDIEAALAAMLPPGVLLVDVAFASGETRTLQHRLGVRPRGVFASLPRSGAISLVDEGRTDSAVTLRNNAGAAGSVDLWVYR